MLNNYTNDLKKKNEKSLHCSGKHNQNDAVSLFLLALINNIELEIQFTSFQFPITVCFDYII